MKRAKKIYNLTMSKVLIQDVLGGAVELSPIDTFSEPGKTEEGVYYIVEDICDYPYRTDVVKANYAGRSVSGATLYTLRDVCGIEVILDNVVFGSKPKSNVISRSEITLL